ncbi:hypothetical protein Ddc_00960 [Ditylenchus destructor]|nr:hypothetical protein Ddc_00960 [Ditylenchus destructor]
MKVGITILIVTAFFGPIVVCKKIKIELQRFFIGGDCKITIEETDDEFTTLNGRCMKLSNGVVGCQSDTFLDPFNADCLFTAFRR